ELGRRQFGSALILSGQGARTRFGVLRISVKISDLRASCARMERFSTLLGGFPGPGLDLHAGVRCMRFHITALQVSNQHRLRLWTAEDQAMRPGLDSDWFLSGSAPFLCTRQNREGLYPTK